MGNRLSRNGRYTQTFVRHIRCCSYHIRSETEKMTNISIVDFISLDNTCIYPQEIGELRNLEILDLTDNQVEYIPDEICDCVALTHLTLSQNFLQSLPRNLGRTWTLVEILLLGSVCDIPLLTKPLPTSTPVHRTQEGEGEKERRESEERREREEGRENESGGRGRE